MMNSIDNGVRAKVLNDALPYIQKYNNKIVVVKYGGNAMTNAELKHAVMSDIVLLSLVGIKVVLVHGGGPEINDMLNELYQNGYYDYKLGKSYEESFYKKYNEGGNN